MRASNNYGPYQYPEKLIPLCILNALAGDPLPVYGDGMQVRNWLYVEDCCSAVDAVLEQGEPGNVYNVGGPDELTNLEVVRRILALTDRDESLIYYVKDRPGHDRRYSLSAARLEALGWKRGRGLRRGDRADGALVPRERGVVGPDPLRRLPGLLRASLRQGAEVTLHAADDLFGPAPRQSQLIPKLSEAAASGVGAELAPERRARSLQ